MRFSIDVTFPKLKSDILPERAGEILHLALEEGFKCLGHELGETVAFSVEKMRQRQSLDLDEKVEQK